jgi:hypothetical protein
MYCVVMGLDGSEEWLIAEQKERVDALLSLKQTRNKKWQASYR